MSDQQGDQPGKQQDKNIEQLAQETEASADTPQPEAKDALQAAAKKAASISAPAPAAAPPPAARKGSGAIAWLALLLALASGAGVGWFVLEQQRLGAGVDDRLQALESIAGRDQAALDELGQRWQEALRSGIAQLEAGLGERDGASAQLGQALQSLQAELEQQRTELARYSANDRETWLLAEVEYLLRLANQRLVMAGDAVSAQALLGSADKILLELDDAGLHGVRAAVAADLADVRAVPRVDVEGTYLRLAALVEQAGKLVIFQLPEQPQPTASAPADNWQGRLQQGYEEALEKLSSYVIIRRRDVPMQVLMDPQWEGLVRQNLRMLLEQAQVALLSGNEELYRESLQRAQHWVAEFFESDEAAARAMHSELAQLVEVDVAVAIPDSSRSLQALDDVMRERLQSGGGE